MNTHELRVRYQPRSVQVLLVGESPPARGTFFYAGNSNLFRFTKQAFEAATNINWSSNEDFLKFFSSHGYFLDDLCLEPVNGLPLPERRRCRKAGVKPLSQRLLLYRPKMILITPKAIISEVNAAKELAQLTCSTRALPFPVMGRQREYANDLAAILREYGA